MRAVWALAAIDATVLLVAVGVVVAEHPVQETARVALAAPDKGEHAAEGASDFSHPAAVLATGEDDGDVEQHHEPHTAAPEMGRAAEVVAACESGKRRAHGTPVLGSHRWHITNGHGGTDSGAFQFVDATWQRVASHIGASQYRRAKDAPPRVQLEAFRWLWRRDPGAWNASRSCWGPQLRE